MDGEDNIAGNVTPVPFSNGTAIRTIDWSYNVSDGLEEKIQSIQQIYTLEVSVDRMRGGK
jgi:hypothetical protein